MCCPLCETNKLCVHARSPLGVGACVPGSLSQTGAPWLPRHYPRSSLLWAPATSHRFCFRPRCSGLSGSALARKRVGSPGLLPILVVRLGAAFDPGWAWPACLSTGHAVACWRLETIGPFPTRSFRDSTPSRSALSVSIAPRLLSCLRIKRVVTSAPARLDTRPVASGYRDGISTR